MPDSVSDNMDGEIYDDVRHWLTGSTGKSLRDKWHWRGQCGAVASGSVTSRLFEFGAIRKCG